MKILMINKFLYIRGGAESYMFNLGRALSKIGNQVFYWGLNDQNNIVEQHDTFVTNYESLDLSFFQRLKVPFNLIYSYEARRKLACFLDKVKPDVVHIHNFNFQLSSSILDVLSERGIPIVYTAHDSQLVCPYHRLFQFNRNATCEKCVSGSFINCLKDRCFDGSVAKSLIATSESYFNHIRGAYKKIDLIISPSNFLKSLLEKKINNRIEVLPNFINPPENIAKPDNLDYVLYFGRLSKEKGISRVISAFEKLEIPLFIVGSGPESDSLVESNFVKLLGRKEGAELFELIRNARFVIQPSIWYENCPMTVIESFAVGTPVIASKHSGFKELIQDGVNGFLVDFNSSSYIDEIRRVYFIDGYTELIRQCLSAFRTKYSPDFHLSEVVKYYTNLLNDSRENNN